MHQPTFSESPAAKGIVIFIHGFMGSPRQFNKLAANVYNHGYSVASLLLPGHGSGIKEFANATAESWLNHVYAEVERFAQHYDKIYLVGHSMGSLLAINAAIRYPQVKGLFLIACPLKVKVISKQALLVRLKQVFYPKNHPLKAAYLNASSIPLHPGLLYHSIKPSQQLKKLIAATKDILNNVAIPVTAIYLAADEIVSLDSLEILQAGLKNTPVKSLILSESLHAYYPVAEQAIIEEALLAALSSVFD